MTTTATIHEWHLSAYTDSKGNVAGMRWSLQTATREDAVAMAGAMPKAVRAKATWCGSDGVVIVEVNLTPNKANGGMNESGVRRARLMMRVVPAPVMAGDSINSASLDQVKLALA